MKLMIRSAPGVFQVHYLTAVAVDGLHGSFHGVVWRFTFLHLGLEVVFVVRADHKEVLTPLIHCDLSFGLDDCVNSSHWRRRKRNRGEESRREGGEIQVNPVCWGTNTFALNSK